MQNAQTQIMQRKKQRKTLRYIKKNYDLYLLLLIPVVYIIIFSYGPLYGIIIAFKDYNPGDGIFGSKWVGLHHFKVFIESYNFMMILKNTVILNLYGLIAGFPIPIIVALMFNELKNRNLRICMQTISYAPHFISVVVMCGMIMIFLSPTTGLVNHVRQMLGMDTISFMQEAKYFRHIFVWTGVWQEVGWNTIIYFAALSTVDQELIDAAKIDGAGRFRIIWNINIPAILPTIVITLIMSCGNILSIGFEKVYLLQNSLNIDTSEVISTYVYKMGLRSARYSFGTAVGLFNSVANFIMLALVNTVAKRVNETSLW